MKLARFYRMHPDEARLQMDEYILRRSWNYNEDYDGEFLSGLCVTAPSGTDWWIGDCFRILEERRLIGDPEYIEATKVLEFYNLLHNWNPHWNISDLEDYIEFEEEAKVL